MNRLNFKHQAFISSTYFGVEDIRLRVSDRLNKCGFITSMMENFSSTKGLDLLDFIATEIFSSDILVCIVFRGKGSKIRLGPRVKEHVPKEDSHISFVEYEVKKALEFGVPVYSFIEGPSDRINDIQRNVEDESDKNFIDLVTSGSPGIAQTFSSASELLDKLLTVITNSVLGNDFSTGAWVRLPKPIVRSLRESEAICSEDAFSINLSNLSVEYTLYLARFGNIWDRDESFDGIIKVRAQQMPGTGLHYLREPKKNLAHGDIFKFYIEVNASEVRTAYADLCSSKCTVTGKGTTVEGEPERSWIWFLAPNFPVHFSSTSIWTINHLFKSEHHAQTRLSGFPD